MKCEGYLAPIVDFCPEYKNDHKMALFIHGLSWSIMINLPIMIKLDFQVGLFTCISIVLNLIIHSYVDNLKANKKTINLVQDQSIHFIQVLATFLIFVLINR